MVVFNPTDQGSVTVSAGTTSAATALVGRTSDVMVTNNGTEIVYIRFGQSTVAATVAASLPIRPESQQVIRKDSNDTHVATITSSSTSSIIFSTGVGA